MVRPEVIFGVCLAASVGIHGVVWRHAGVRGPAAAPAHEPQQERIEIRLARVELQGQPEPPPEPEPPPPEQTVALRFESPEETIPDPVPPPPEPIEETPEPEPEPELEPEMPEPTVLAEGHEESMRTYWDEVRGRIASRLTYPSQAKRRRRQGVVRLHMVIDSTGRLQEVQDQSLRADAWLNQAVLQATENASPFPPPPAEILDHGRVAAELSIRFQLTR